MCNGKTARRAAIFQRELCEGVLIGIRNYPTRHRRMQNNAHFYVDGCGIMTDGDDDKATFAAAVAAAEPIGLPVMTDGIRIPL